VVLKTTALASGYPVMDDAEGWGRLNLFAAADGYGSFSGNVTIVMDAPRAASTPWTAGATTSAAAASWSRHGHPEAGRRQQLDRRHRTDGRHAAGRIGQRVGAGDVYNSGGTWR
jgi:hypothetical protein